MTPAERRARLAALTAERYGPVSALRYELTPYLPIPVRPVGYVDGPRAIAHRRLILLGPDPLLPNYTEEATP